MDLNSVRNRMFEDVAFEEAYKSCANKNGSSIGPQRRKIIFDWFYATTGMYASMTTQLKLEQACNIHWDLNPYGLEQPKQKEDEMSDQPKDTAARQLGAAQSTSAGGALCGSTGTVPVAVVETKTYIYGRESSTVSDNDVFRYIGDLEGEIRRLEGIINKPKKLEARITALEAEIAELVKVVDERE